MRAADVLALGSSECISVPKWLVAAAGGVVEALVLQSALTQQASAGRHNFWDYPRGLSEWACALGLQEHELQRGLEALIDSHLLEIEDVSAHVQCRRYKVSVSTIASLLEA